MKAKQCYCFKSGLATMVIASLLFSMPLDLLAASEKETETQSCPTVFDAQQNKYTSTGWLFGLPPIGSEFWASIEIFNPGSEKVTVTVEPRGEEFSFIDNPQTLELEPGDQYTFKTVDKGGNLPIETATLKIEASAPVEAQETIAWVSGPWMTTVPGLPQESITRLTRDVTASTNSCCGYSSSDNPYPCCGSKGNCTWWAWKQAKGEWDKKLPKWGDAKNWAKNAKASGYPVKSTPKKNTIGCNTWIAGTGHVAWVKKVNGSSVEVSEMNWCASCKKNKTYPKSWFNGGYIYKK